MESINQSSLSRLLDHSTKHDCAMLTAFRSNLSKEENKKRNTVLAKALKRYGYVLTVVDGVYHEQGAKHPTKEDSFFVVNVKDDPQFKKHCCDLAEEFEQDSIAYMPAGSLGKDAKEKPYLIGTKPEGEWPKYGETVKFDGTNFGKHSTIRTQINGRPFNFTFNESINKDNILSAAFNKRGMFTAMLTEKEFKERAPRTYMTSYNQKILKGLAEAVGFNQYRIALPYIPDPVSENKEWIVYLPETFEEYEALTYMANKIPYTTPAQFSILWNEKKLIPYVFVRKEGHANAGSFKPHNMFNPMSNVFIALYRSGATSPTSVYDGNGKMHNGFPTRDEILSMKFGKKLDIPEIKAIEWKPNYFVKLTRFGKNFYTCNDKRAKIFIKDDLIKNGKLSCVFTKTIECKEFVVSAKELTTFKNFPEIIIGDFTIVKCGMDSLNGCPKKVTGNFESPFSVEEVEKHCHVFGDIFVNS